MSDRYPIPAGESYIELQVKNSLFIGRAAYTPTVDEARAYIDRIRQEYADASHVVYAFAVGHGASVTHGLSDAGEPGNTAGKPALAVVQGSGLGDVTVTISRYFGGTKLGTGGLVKAYTEATQLALAALPRAEKVEYQAVQVTVPYPLYEQTSRLVQAHQGRVEDEQFTTEVTLRLLFTLDDLPAFEAALQELSRGAVEVSRLGATSGQAPAS